MHLQEKGTMRLTQTVWSIIKQTKQILLHYNPQFLKENVVNRLVLKKI